MNFTGRFLFSSRIASLLLGLLAASASAVDIAGSFSTVSNPHGAWTYGYSTTLGGAFTAHAGNGTTGSGLDFWNTNLGGGVPWIAHNPTTTVINQSTLSVEPGKISLHPGASGEYSVVRFTAPVAGDYNVVGSFFGQDILGTPKDVHVLRNNVAKFASPLAGFGPASAVVFDLKLTLGVGDTVDFAVGNGADLTSSFDSTGLDGSIALAPVTINSISVTNYTGYIIEADRTDGDPATNRQRIRTEAELNIVAAGNYRADWTLVDPSNNVVAADSETLPLGSVGIITTNAQIVPALSPTLVPGTLYRVKISLVDVATGVVLAKTSEPTGRTYIHFPGTDSASNDLNVVGWITDIDVTTAQNWLLETDPTNNKVPVIVAYNLYRYDDWLGASVNRSVVCNLASSIKRDSDSAAIASTATGAIFVSAPLASFAAGAPKTPALISGIATIMVDPTEILALENHRFEATISHIDLPPFGNIRTDNTNSSAQKLIYHYSGQLNFGSTTTHFSHFASPPVQYFGPNPPPGAVWRQITPDADSGTVDGRPEAHYGDGQVLNISLGANGVADFLPGNAFGGALSVALGPLPGPRGAPALAITGTVNGVFFQLGSMTLDTLGAHGSVSAFLPAGVGWTASRGTGLLGTLVPFPITDLAQDLSPVGPLVVATFAPGDFFLCEETKPVFIETASLSWDIATGAFLCGTGSARSIRQPLLDLLASYSAEYSDPSMEKKRSNDHLYNTATTATGISVVTGASGGGELSGSIGLGAGEFVTHFPYNSTVKWNSVSSIAIAGDLIAVASSSLASADPLSVSYWQHCQELVEADCGAVKLSNITFTPSAGTLLFTADGGIQSAGTAVVPGNLSWGWSEEAGQFAHRAETFTAGNFLMAGTFLRGDQNPFGGEDGASVLLLSGFDPANTAVAERPITAAYLMGVADYAGMNFRCTSGTVTGQSTLQGTPYGGYPLTTRSKYYARRSGVTGIHEAVPAGFPGSALLAGYAFTFTDYGFSFLSNEMEDTLINGSLALPSPVNFALDFTHLELSCVGSLVDFDVTGAGLVDSKEFDFWNAPFTPFTCSFVQTDGCDPGSGTTLVLGFSAHASHFTAPFAGALGIKPDGNFATELNIVNATVAATVPTRLVLPASVAVTGTTGESYTFFPAQGAYLNSATGAETGYWSLFGTLDVPFFENMEINLHASCAVADMLSPLYFMGGWSAALGWTDANALSPFDVATFDTTHVGLPPSVALADYRKTNDDGTDLYLPRASKLWLGIVDFDYPLKWSHTSFNFLSRGPVQSDLLGLLNTQHELLFLDAKNAEITFGLRYDGLPEISLTNFVFNAVDDATGTASALISAAGTDVVAALEGGVDEFGNALSDEAEKFMGRAVDANIALPVDGLIAVVKNEMSDAVWTTADIEAAIGAYLATPANQLGTALKNLGAPYSNPLSFSADLDLRLAKIEQGIDSVINTVPTASGGNADGMLKKNGALRRAIFEATAAALVDTLNTAVPSGSIATELNALIAAQEPTLNAATTALTEVRAIVSTLRTELQSNTGFGDELRDIIAAATTQIGDIATNVGLQSSALFEAVKAEDVAAAGALDALGDEWHAAIAQMVKDELYATQMMADIQSATKDRLYDLQGAFNGAVDTAFASLNLSIRDALSPVLAELDNSIDKLTGPLGNNISTGQINGVAHINGDSLDALRLDAKLVLKAPDALTLAGFIEIKELDSDGPRFCAGTGEPNVEVTIGALNIPIAWTGLSVGDDTRADLDIKASFSATGVPVGFGGGFEMTQGSISFEAFKITTLAADAMFSIPDGAGNAENYFAAVVGMDFGSYGLGGGVFFGQSCDLDPIILIDPLVASILPGPSFTGVYAYGEVTIPIYSTGTCFFDISAKAGAGVFFAAEGPTYGGRLSLGIYGTALCVVSVGGEVDLVGAKAGNTYAFAGSGRVFGKAGICPFCTEADFNCDFNYTDSTGWKVKF